MKLTMLGTGNAVVTECYNTCFLLDDGGSLFMVDAGGGNGILRQIRLAGYDCADVRRIFVTHKHVDHLLGVIWMIRVLSQPLSRGVGADLCIYSHREVLGLIRDMTEKLLQKKQAAMLGERIHLVEVKDGESRGIIGHETTFFDIRSTKAKQFGFRMALGGGRSLVCCGDEPLTPPLEKYAEGADWLLHEAFCLHSEADVFSPYQKHHSTVKDACELAERLGAKNLLLYHTEDRNLSQRKELYTEEGRRYYSGALWVPDDLEAFEL